MPELICKILHIGKTTYYKYVKEGYPIITFLLSLQKSELEELLLTGKIDKFENIIFLNSYQKQSRTKYLSINFDILNKNSICENFHYLFLHYISNNYGHFDSFSEAAYAFSANYYIPSSPKYFNKVLKNNILPFINDLDKSNLYMYISYILSSNFEDLLKVEDDELHKKAINHISIFNSYKTQYNNLIEKKEFEHMQKLKLENFEEMYQHIKNSEVYLDYISSLGITKNEADNYFLSPSTAE